MDDERLAEIASWYYEDGLDQAAIARRLGCSRSMVSRYLKEARARGLVEVRIRHPLKTDPQLAKALQSVFPLREARVLADPPLDSRLLLRRLGELGARGLQEQLRPGVRIGVSWGTAVYEVVRAMPELPVRGAQVIQIIGALGSGDPMIDGPELARWLAEKLEASVRHLHAPLLVESEAVAQALQQERAIAETLAVARQVHVALIGIGSVDPRLSSLRRAGYLTEAELEALRAAGAVGDVLARALDGEGNLLDLPLNRRVVGLEPEALRRIPTVIAVAGGVAKAPAIRAALRGGYVDVLVTDAEAAAAVLTLEGAMVHA
ncbi:sugar-binding transcriptional regulator [Thermoflexus sp.]|uniref:sugar-binding transcriptional regulator n=1 Tax=Thermoflexus sp. TaxID=1969742 RepID=UPI0025D4675C|nr:sugar-binding transcriptional regulator [Thermoflexus sp.]MDW8179463.1 sugar-binding transcriptional regulator [Anaerolineae bacterium]MCS6964719.1 sugar-binding transcriptional regulator [Thermoflexus sp.]MCS7350015.1 sugar-binding transcriptional regulator [Thermoflexus sp.]MCX7691286.1 sugar-binding transcriptional regulator [Thermoflexus sp.]MDW8184407.1 sugar-binding transcriptional regulator [Anaerolineae bacterium]